MRLFFSITIAAAIAISLWFCAVKADADTWLGSNHIPTGVNWTSYPIPATGINWTDVRVLGSQFGDHSGINWQAFGV